MARMRGRVVRVEIKMGPNGHYIGSRRPWFKLFPPSSSPTESRNILEFYPPSLNRRWTVVLRDERSCFHRSTETGNAVEGSARCMLIS